MKFQIAALIKYIQKGSWKTTTLGLFGLIAAISYVVISILLENSTEKYPILEQIKGYLPAFMVIFPSLAAVFARDNNKTSKDVGAEEPSETDEDVEEPGDDADISKFVDYLQSMRSGRGDAPGKTVD